MKDKTSSRISRRRRRTMDSTGSVVSSDCGEVTNGTVKITDSPPCVDTANNGSHGIDEKMGVGPEGPVSYPLGGEGAVENGPIDEMSQLSEIRSVLRQRHIGEAKNGGPASFGALSQALAAIERQIDDTPTDTVVNVFTRFPLPGSLEEDYERYRLVERAESAEKLVEKLREEIVTLRERLHSSSKESSNSVLRSEPKPTRPGVWICKKCPSGTINGPEDRVCQTCGCLPDGTVPHDPPPIIADPGVVISENDSLGFSAW